MAVEPILGFKGSYRWLSNFAPSRVTLDGATFPTVENAFQAAKTLVQRERGIFTHVEPRAAKLYGRRLALRSDWDAVKESVMLELLRQKYAQEPYRSLLLDTGEAYIEETNSWGDRYWGVDTTGLNRLGHLIMQVRDEIKHQAVL